MADEAKRARSKNQTAGVALYDPAAQERIAREAMAGKQADVARKYKISKQTVSAYVRKLREKAGRATDAAQVTPARPTGGVPRRGAAYAGSGQRETQLRQEIIQLKEENRLLKEVLVEERLARVKLRG